MQANLVSFCQFHQGVIDPTGTETFAKEPKFARLLRELKFFSYVCNRKFVVFWVLLSRVKNLFKKMAVTDIREKFCRVFSVPVGSLVP